MTGSPDDELELDDELLEELLELEEELLLEELLELEEELLLEELLELEDELLLEELLELELPLPGASTAGPPHPEIISKKNIAGRYLAMFPTQLFL